MFNLKIFLSIQLDYYHMVSLEFWLYSHNCQIYTKKEKAVKYILMLSSPSFKNYNYFAILALPIPLLTPICFSGGII